MIKFFHGTDAYRIREAVNEYLSEKPNSSLIRLDLIQDHDVEELERELKYLSLFQNERVIIASGALTDAKTAQTILDVLQRHTPNHDRGLCLILLGGSKPRPSNSIDKLLEYLEKNADSKKFDLLKGAEQAKWINDFCNKRGKPIQPSVTSLLVNRIGPETWAIAMELEKLCAYSKDGIDAVSLTTLTHMPTEQNEFELSDAIYTHNKRSMVSALWRSLTGGDSEQLLLGMLASGVRTMLTVKSGQASVKMAGIHPFVIQKASRGATAYTEKQLLDAHHRLSRLDRDYKDGKADLADGLMKIVLDL